MTEASARVIDDTITEQGERLTTVEATCWRPVLAEQNTHCVLSRNSASSRAIPVTKMLDRYVADFAMPVVWGSEQKGMQAGPPLDGNGLDDAKKCWNDLRWATTKIIREYVESHPVGEDAPEGAVRLHKSLLNRWLETGLWQTQIISATNWEGYFWQRCHKDAEPHIRAMAEAIREARDASTPRLLLPGEWHLPYWDKNGGHESDWSDAAGDTEIAKRCSAARCARVSYLTQSGIRDLQEDLGLFYKLTANRVGSEDPPHASPLEHVATPWPENSQLVTLPNGNVMGPVPKLGKFLGYCQLRHLELGF